MDRIVRSPSNRAAEAAAAFGGIMMSTFELRRSLAAIRQVARYVPTHASFV